MVVASLIGYFCSIFWKAPSLLLEGGVVKEGEALLDAVSDPMSRLHHDSLFNLLDHLRFGCLALLWGNRWWHRSDPPHLLVKPMGFLLVHVRNLLWKST